MSNGMHAALVSLVFMSLACIVLGIIKMFQLGLSPCMTVLGTQIAFYAFIKCCLELPEDQ